MFPKVLWEHRGCGENQVSSYYLYLVSNLAEPKLSHIYSAVRKGVNIWSLHFFSSNHCRVSADPNLQLGPWNSPDFLLCFSFQAWSPSETSDQVLSGLSQCWTLSAFPEDRKILGGLFWCRKHWLPWNSSTLNYRRCHSLLKDGMRSSSHIGLMTEGPGVTWVQQCSSMTVNTLLCGLL